MTYRVDIRRDGAYWLATVRGVRGCHTQGRTIAATRRRIREALRLFVDDVDTATVTELIHLPAPVHRMMHTLHAKRQAAQRTDRAAQDVYKALARLLEHLRLSTRDQASLLGLSHQRVHQLKAAQR